MTSYCSHPLFAGSVVAAAVSHIGASTWMFAMKVICVGNKMACMSDQFNPRADYQPSVMVGDVGCLSTTNFYTLVRRQKSTGTT
jgi:peptide deformylase